MTGISLFFILVLATFYRIYIALETHPGLTIKNPYEQGENYAQTLAKKEKLRKLGWQVTLELPKKLQTTIKQTYKASLFKNNKLLKSEKAVLFFYRPSSVEADFKVIMQPDKESYIANVSVPLKGRWEVSVYITKNKRTLQKTKAVFYSEHKKLLQ